MKINTYQEPTVAVAEDGDILLPLNRLEQRYLDKAALLETKAHGDKKAEVQAVIGYYLNAATRVGNLVKQNA